MESIYHLAPTADIDRAARSGQYSPPSLAADGYIHCSRADQVQHIADSKFGTVASVVLLEIDPARVPARIVEEGSQRYPHIYGPLPMSAVVSVRELDRTKDGRLYMPCTITGNCACRS